MAVSFNRQSSDYRLLNSLTSPAKKDHVIKTRNTTKAVLTSLPLIDDFIESGMIESLIRHHLMFFNSKSNQSLSIINMKVLPFVKYPVDYQLPAKKILLKTLEVVVRC